MFTCTPNTTWFQGLSNLFCSKNLLPMSNMSLEEQINAITRIVLVIFIIILLFDLKCSMIFLIVSLVFIIILYYLQRNMMEKFKTESFKELSSDPDDNSKNPKYQVPPKPKVSYIYANCEYDLQPKQKPLFCDDRVDAYSRASMNQNLAGKPNPKTLIQPVSVTPAFDVNWRATNDTVEFKGNNNREGVYDLFQSGYKSIDDIENEDGGSYEGYQQHYSTYNSNVRPMKYNNEPPSRDMDNDNSFHSRNVNTQTIQPGVYFKNHGLETIDSNIGITETRRRNEPVKSIADNGDVYYDEYNNDARFKAQNNMNKAVGPEDIYDPRFTGYGTSYRSYFDENVGQPRFYYDDVNAMRMPNYVVRSKIDNLPFSDQYGPMSDDYEERNQNMRQMVNQSFLDDSLSFRNDLQERLMRKRNAEMAYIRQFPKSTSNRRMLRG